MCSLARAQVKASVPDETDAGRGYVVLKEVTVELPYYGIVGNKMLYGAKNMTGAAEHITLYSAYGIIPRTYDFPDPLDKYATFPFMDVTIEKKKFTYATCYTSSSLSTACACSCMTRAWATSSRSP